MAQNQGQIAAETIAEPVTSSSQTAALPDAPRPQKVIDKKFILVLGSLAASETLRITSNTLALEREFTEGAPWVTSAPNHRNLTAKNGAIFASELIVAYELKKPHSWLPGDKVIRKLWWVYPVAMTAIHFKKAAHTMRMRAPAGCTPDECGLP
jgi:hypothetical protein